MGGVSGRLMFAPPISTGGGVSCRQHRAHKSARTGYPLQPFDGNIEVAPQLVSSFSQRGGGSR
jgi:hypothetical protein